ncbi:MAG: rhombosortase [Gammaproteobacteria bacterium]|nr:MAG: rhombosortase [Gammaproteobacteria bacterium]
MSLSALNFKPTTNILISALISVVIFVCAVFPGLCFPWLSLDRLEVGGGEWWRVFSSNFVHFGWAHTLMNLAAFQIATFILFNSISSTRFVSLILLCNLSVGLGIYYLNPEYLVYAGFSGSIHGLLVAGLMFNKRHPVWVNSIFIALLFGKIFYEHQPDYQTNDIQNLLPVPVAYDAHLYGAIAGLIFGVFTLLMDKFTRLSKH